MVRVNNHTVIDRWSTQLWNKQRSSVRMRVKYIDVVKKCGWKNVLDRLRRPTRWTRIPNGQPGQLWYCPALHKFSLELIYLRADEPRTKRRKPRLVRTRYNFDSLGRSTVRRRPPVYWLRKVLFWNPWEWWISFEVFLRWHHDTGIERWQSRRHYQKNHYHRYTSSK